MSKWPIGVFTSIDAGLGVHLEVAQELNIPTVQLHAPARSGRNEKAARNFLGRCAETGITVTCVFSGFEGESYADIATTARTVGLVPEATRAARLGELQDISDFARLLDCTAIGLHLGFVPADRDGASYHGLLDCTRTLLQHARQNGQNVHLETGQETADHLLDFIQDVGRDNLFINFDPANMILYGTGDPLEALHKVAPFVRSVHCKDGKWTTGERGKDWGIEVPLGDGDVGMEQYLRALDEIGYTGPLTIEREIAHDPDRQKADIGHAVAILEQLRARLA